MAVNSCNQNKYNESLKKFSAINSFKVNSMIYVIPGSGCKGCISDIESLAIANANNDSIYFLFTRIRSLKIFKSKFNTLYTARNVIIDSLNEFTYPDQKYEIYPALYKKLENNTEFIQYFKP